MFMAILAAVSSVLVPARAFSQATNVDNFYSIVDRLSSSPPRSREDLEQIIGVRLSFISRSDFDTYQAINLSFGDIDVRSVDYRMSNGAGEDFTSWIQLNIEGRCLEYHDVITRYGMDYIASTRHAVDERTYSVVRKSWGTLRFGFSSASRQCLEAIIFELGT